MLVLDDNTAHSPIALSAGLPGGIQLLKLPNPQNVCKVMAAPDTDGWKEAMDHKMDNLKSHNVYELVLHTGGMHTLGLGGCFTMSSRMACSKRIRVGSSLEVTTSFLTSTTANHSCQSCALNLSAPSCLSSHSRPQRHSI